MTPHDDLATPTCPDCGTPLPVVKITESTIPAEAFGLCSNPDCGAAAKWAEHYDGDILRFPKIELGDAQ